MSTFTSSQWIQKAYDIIMSKDLTSEEAESIAIAMWNAMDSKFFSRVIQELESEVSKNEV